MKPFITHSGLVAPLDRVNVDTDQMVPKQFLKALDTPRIWPHTFLRLALFAGRKTKSRVRAEFPALQRRFCITRAR